MPNMIKIIMSSVLIRFLAPLHYDFNPLRTLKEQLSKKSLVEVSAAGEPVYKGSTSRGITI